MGDGAKEAWAAGEPYEQFIGRWSRRVAAEFLGWLGVPADQTWCDVGCGTGALTATILAAAEPREVVAADRSAGFLRVARTTLPDRRAFFTVADASALPCASGRYAAVVSGLVLNFVPDPSAMLSEMVRVTRPGGQVAVYVWDYRSGMEMLRSFWDAAATVDPAAAALDEGERFPLCQPEPLRAAFESAGLRLITVEPLVTSTVFPDFEAYWAPFLGGQGPAPTYLASLADETREQIRALLQARLSTRDDGSVPLSARAWAAQGTV